MAEGAPERRAQRAETHEVETSHEEEEHEPSVPESHEDQPVGATDPEVSRQALENTKKAHPLAPQSAPVSAGAGGSQVHAGGGHGHGGGGIIGRLWGMVVLGWHLGAAFLGHLGKNMGSEGGGGGGHAPAKKASGGGGGHH